MHKDTGIAENQLPPQGQVSEQLGQDEKKKVFKTKQKGDRGFIEGCLFALCCCWVCEMCF
ncbi:hypothetical protein EUTSA_v10015225mg [Eutrema salsugineum]|uniref:Cysteine-rich transmembrane domain-containing protein n=1 Tax=Eutrema salsugineum TaxID=72664 RepID=V4LKH1_EUTSA|nr:hypothetical protein EUTSA_v10015225mg [Eutrema salsugineum]